MQRHVQRGGAAVRLGRQAPECGGSGGIARPKQLTAVRRTAAAHLVCRSAVSTHFTVVRVDHEGALRFISTAIQVPTGEPT